MNPKINSAILDIYKESIKNPPKTLDGHIKNENGITNDYRGRAIYEFFQNAIDRAKSKIWIHLDKLQRTLIVANDGVEFSIEKEDRNYSDLESLCSINTSSKNQNESIGNKGVGFKSCWEYTQKVCVCSIFEDTPWGFELHNPLTIDNIITSIGTELIEKWKSDNDYSVVFKNNDNRIPSFYFPLPIENADSYFESFNDAITVITFHDLTDEKLEDLEKKIIEFSEHQIFFVQQLDKLKNSNVQLELKVDNTFEKTLNTKANSEEWFIINKEFKDDELLELQERSAKLNYKIENPKIAIAFPLQQKMNEGSNYHSNFYCYLPTEVKCGFNVLIHGDFLLDVSRKQVDFENNPYNERLLKHVAKLFVKTLLLRTELHSLAYFGNFLLPINRDGKIENYIRKELFSNSTITSILKKVYTEDRNWEENSYRFIFDVIDKWKRNDKQERAWTDFYSNIYTETIRYFCDPSIFIVPIVENNMITFRRTLPEKNDKDKKLFYRSENSNTFNYEILKDFENIAITSFESVKQPYFDGSIVKQFSNIEILRAINAEKRYVKFENSDFNQTILKFVRDLIQDVSIKPDKQVFITGETIERQLSKINLPCTDGKWHPAIQCYADIIPEINAHFNSNEFFELNISEFRKLIGGENLEPAELDIALKKFGVWKSTLPFQYENRKFKLPFTHLPQLRNNNLKVLINNSIKDWQNIEGRNDLIRAIKSEVWFFDQANKSFASPANVFLLNDARPRKCIFQEQKSNELKELYHFLNIESIEETEDSKKLTTQLEIMKLLEVDENHKTVYKQLVLRISRLKDVNIKEIPLLTTESKYKNELCWFVPYDQRKYVHHFSEYNFVNFDVNTAKGFIENLSLVKLFEPEFTIKPEMDQLKKDSAIKGYFEKEYLPDFFALAENVISSVDFDKVECIKRWNNLEIYKAHDVWLEVTFNSKITELYKNEKKEVLYKPISKSARGTIKESVGLLAYDLDTYETNHNLSKFGIAIAEAVFRNQNFGEILSNYIQKKQSDSQNANEYLKERGIGDVELDQIRKFIDVSLVNHKEMEDFLQTINVNNKDIGIDNWTEKCFYSGLTFKEFRSFVIRKMQSFYENTSKFESLMDLINPYETNLKFLIDQKQHLEICYYASYNEELSNEKFDRIIKDKSNVEELYRFDFDLNHCYSILRISSIIDSISLEKAETKLKILAIQREFGFPEEIEFTPVLSNGITPKKISAVGKPETNIVNKTYEDREKESRKQHNRGIGLEKILTLKYAQQLLETEQSEYLKEHICRFKELDSLKIPDKFENVDILAKILHVSKSIGDGLGYDILEPVIENGKLKQINRVEIKSSKSNHTIYLSENERLKILHFADENSVDWKLYHFIDGKAFNRTETIFEVVKAHAENYNGEQLLVAENWYINFEN